VLPRFIGLSLLGHAVLLAVLPAPPRKEAKRPFPLVAVSFELVNSSLTPRTEAPTPVPPTRKVAIRRTVNQPLELPARSVKPEFPAEGASASPSSFSVAPQVREEPGVGGRPEAPEPLVAPLGSASTGGVRVDAVDVEAVRVAIDRRLVYPLRARRMGWSGRVVVAFKLDEHGAPSEVRVASSSGFGSLDEAALEAVRSAAPFDAPRRRVSLEVPVSFRLGR
jgi:periplasmic protein TonB